MNQSKSKLGFNATWSLAIAGHRALGTVGLVVATIAAALSTGSAINVTLFATARLANKVAEDGEFGFILKIILHWLQRRL